MPPLPLIPPPRRISRGAGQWVLPAAGSIFIGCDDKPLTLAARSLQQLLERGAGKWRLSHTPPTRRGITLRLDPDGEHEQGYRIDIRPEGVIARAKTSQGLFYAVQTLRQIARHCRRAWPCLRIIDQPDFSRRGFYHDVSRGKVPKVQTILWLVDKLAELKINEFQLYIENVFEFRRHPDFYFDTTPLTAAEIRRIDAACRQRYIDFVPSLSSLGHFEKILRLPRYRHLAEAEPADLKKRGINVGSEHPWSLCVTDPEAKKLISDMYDEFLPNFSSPIFNICCDESYDLGLGRSRVAAREKGAGRLYVDWVKYCAAAAAKHAKRVQLWGDIILHHPRLIDELPSNATVLEWGYGAEHPFLEHGRLFAAAGRPFYVCPGTSCWNSLGGRTANALANMRVAARAGLQHGATGYLNTDWGDNGHQQMLAVSLLPMACGASISWNHRQPHDWPIRNAVSEYLFDDPGGKIARLAADIGLVYQRINRDRLSNSSLDFHLFREPWDQTTYLTRARLNQFPGEIARLNRYLAVLERAPFHSRSQALIVDELSFTVRLIRHTLRRTILRAQGDQLPDKFQSEVVSLMNDIGKLKREFRALWRMRNKESRLADVMAHFDRRAAEYRHLVYTPAS